MKRFMLMGGLAGFVMALLVGWFGDVSWPVLLCRASVAALAAGLLLRWWWSVCMQSLQDSLNQEAEDGSNGTPPGAQAGVRS